MNSLNLHTPGGEGGTRSVGLKKWGEVAVGHDVSGAETEIWTVLVGGERVSQF
jgi:hypothetical protein